MLGDLTVHLPASLCQRLDRSSMAHSLEARVPFLSHRFVEWALTIPADLKLKGSTGKYVLRRADRALASRRRALLSARSASSCPSPTGSWAGSTILRARPGVRRELPNSASSIAPALNNCSMSTAAAPPTTGESYTRSRCSAAGGVSSARLKAVERQRRLRPRSCSDSRRSRSSCRSTTAPTCSPERSRASSIRSFAISS